MDASIEEQAPIPVAEPLPEPEILPDVKPAIEDTIASVTVPNPDFEPEPEPESELKNEIEIYKETDYISPVDQEQYISIPKIFIYLENRKGSVEYRLDGQNIIFKFILDTPPDRERNLLFLMGDTPGLYHNFSLPKGTLTFLVTIDIDEYKQFKEGVIVGFGGRFLGVNDEFCEYLEL
jgi:hypothetical protein